MAVPSFVDRVTLHVSAGNVEFGTKRGRRVINIVPTAAAAAPVPTPAAAPAAAPVAAE